MNWLQTLASITMIMGVLSLGILYVSPHGELFTYDVSSADMFQEIEVIGKLLDVAINPKGTKALVQRNCTDIVVYPYPVPIGFENTSVRIKGEVQTSMSGNKIKAHSILPE